MRKIKIILIAFFCCIIITNAQFEKQLDNVAKTVFELCKKSEYKKAAIYFAYSEDNGKTFSRNVNPESRSELKPVKRICKKIKGLVKISSGYEITNHKKNNNIFTCSVIFDSGKQKLNFFMSFVKVKNKYMLVNFK